MSQDSSSRWPQSPAHMVFLSEFLHPRPRHDLSPLIDWKWHLGQDPQDVLAHFLDEGLLIYVDQDQDLAQRMQRFTAAQLRDMARDRELSSRGRKDELSAALIEADRAAMEQALADIAPLVCTELGADCLTSFMNQAPADREDVTSSLPMVPVANEPPGGYVARGISLAQAGEYDQALNQFGLALAENPDDTPALYNRGLVYERLGDLPRALIEYNRALSADPGMALAYAGRGGVYRKLGDYRLALADYDKALRLDAQLILAYHNRGVTHEKMGEYTQALGDYSQAIALDPGATVAYVGRGIAYEHLGDYALALADLETALSQSGSDRFKDQIKAHLRHVDMMLTF